MYGLIKILNHHHPFEHRLEKHIFVLLLVFLHILFVFPQNILKKPSTHFHALEKEMATPVFLPGESQGWGSLVGCHLWSRTESDVTEAT